ncbi:hypothetical protein F4680DRAFT_454035 [Xylaria scruposa]|nr:hypothetical protein F4680DRAFT_454035 [Xylaria scruposa]
MSWQTSPPSGVGGATATPDGVDETIQGLSALNISNVEAGSGAERFAQIAALARAKLGGYHFTHHLCVNPWEANSFITFIRHATFYLCATRLRDERLREGSEDFYAEVVYDPVKNDVQLWIWIWAGSDLISTKARMVEFESDMGKFHGLHAPRLHLDQLRVVWRVCHNGQTYSRQVAWWPRPSETGQYHPLSNCLRNYSSGIVSLGWFQAAVDRVGGPIKSMLPLLVYTARLAERESLLDVDTALGHN